ncbi:MAG: hypothetical protein E5W00_18100, partial [Mesorhizobium sp.]
MITQATAPARRIAACIVLATNVPIADGLQGCQCPRIGIFSRRLNSAEPTMSFQKLDDLGHKLEALEHALAIL